MEWFILFIIIGIIVTPILVKKDREKYKTYNLLFESTYIRGLKNILDREKVHFIIKDNKLHIEFLKSHRSLGLMPIDNIKAIEGTSEEYIKEGVTFTRMVALGILSLAATKTKISNRKFIIIHLNNDDIIVFEDEFAENKVNKLNEILFAGV